MRNCFASYRGGAYSRAGTKFVGQCLQPGTGATPYVIPFQFSVTQGIVIECGDNYFRFAENGEQITENPIAITAISNANPGVLTITTSYANGDWVFLNKINGMPRLSDNVYVVAGHTSTSITLKSTLTGAAIDTTTFGTYTGGGTAARIYTLATPYAAVDLPYLKWTESADVMTLTCVNQITHTEYPPQDLARISSDNWTLTQTTFSASIIAPATITASASTTTTSSPTDYQYVVTAVDANTAEESVASAIADVPNSVDIAQTAGSITVTWSSVSTAGYYNIYRAPPAYATVVPAGSLFGFVGTATGVAFVDSNIIADLTQVPPTHTNPFATSQTISNGTYPSCAAYFQQRRFYANTSNMPDTYFASKPGTFTNFDTSIPVQDDDAITGTPWAQQVNGIQFMVPMPNGLVILTGLGAWQLSGGGQQTAVTPADQTAVPQAYNGCSPINKPLTINYDILYVQEKGSIVRDLAYNFFVNIYTGTDLTVLSGHLFSGYQIVDWDWAEEPFKLVWAVRNDGTLLCMTYLKEQDVYAWSRHDTNGLFQSVAVISEPPVNAPYFVVRRLIQGDGAPTWAYYLERMDNRIWPDAAHCWCVDAGLTYPQNYPNATLQAVSSTGAPTLQEPTVVADGQNYSDSTFARIVDPTGVDATVTLTIAGGVITAAAIGGTITGYTSPSVVVTDPTGAGLGAVINIQSYYITTFNTNAPVFSNAAGLGAVGDVLNFAALSNGTADNHPGGGIATVLQYVGPSQLIVRLTQPITAVIPNDPFNTPFPQTAGSWSIINPVMTIYGLDHLEGMSVAILADGYTPGNQTVVNGMVTLPNPASTITIGLPFLPQVQTLYMEMQYPDGTVQTRRKNIQQLSVRVEDSRGVEVGTNQPDQATQPNGATVAWKNMTPIPPGWGVTLPNNAPSLFTGDQYSLVPGDENVRGQVAFQQPNPLPMQLSAVVSWVQVNDDSGL